MTYLKTVSTTILLVTIGIIISFVSCAGYKPFMAPGFTGENLTKGGLAVFPALIAEGSQSVPGIQKYVRTAGEVLTSELQKAQPSLKVVGPTQVSAALANNDLVGDFSKMKQNYQFTGIVDVGLAKKISQPLNVQYFMLPSINSLYAKTKSTAVAQMSVKVYDAQSAELVFEAVKKGEETSIFGNAPYEKAIKRASQNLTRTLLVVYRAK